MMASSGSVFSDTLQEITATKLDELSKRHSAFEETKTSLLLAVQIEQDPVKRLVALSEGVKSCLAIKTSQTGEVLAGQTKYPQLESQLRNLDRFLDQARCDPSVSTTMLAGWERSLYKHLDEQSLKFRYAALYGKLVTEWLSVDKFGKEVEGGGVEIDEAFEMIGDPAKMEFRSAWEKMAFHPAGIDEGGLQKYLDHLFGTDDHEKKNIQDALFFLRKSVQDLELSLSKPNQFNTTSLNWLIRGLLSSEQLTNEKREALKDFEQNPTILNEIADVLNMRLAALGSWTWNGKSHVPVEVRRKISGVYDVRMDEDLLQSIFLQYIGVRWSVFFKHALRDFRKAEGVWKSMRKEIPEIDWRRLEYYLGPLSAGPCLELIRKFTYTRQYFLAHMVSSVYDNLASEDGEEEANYVPSEERPSKPGRGIRKAGMGMGGAMRHRRIRNDWADDSDEDTNYESELGEKEKKDLYNPIRLKQNLLHMLSTDMILNKRLYGEMTAFHSVFDKWDAALPHETVHGILEFFGVSSQWLGFFKKFLQAPLRFVDDGGDGDNKVRPRLGGTPSSYVLSDVFGETALFCLDFAVIHATEGEPLWRIREDVWFWSRDHAKAARAWDAVDRFASATGTSGNQHKTGTVRISRDSAEELPIDKSLPEGEIRWGFLRLSPRTGQFEIDQTMVDVQIEELRRQLSGKHSRSILGFTQAWNTFAATFFNTNFGTAAGCFGRQHVDNMLATHQRIQREIFGSLHTDGSVSSVAEHLKKELESRFDVTDVPDGYLYFPIELGGLGLQSSFVSLLQIRDGVLESPDRLLDNLEDEERKAWVRFQRAFMNSEWARERQQVEEPDWKPESQHDRENFMSFDEYIRYRECISLGQTTAQRGVSPVFKLPHSVYNQLMEKPSEKSVDLQEGGVSVALRQLKLGRTGGELKGITGDWEDMEPYWQWMAMMYGPEVVEKYGDLNIVDAGLLPMGMVSLFREKRVKW